MELPRPPCPGPHLRRPRSPGGADPAAPAISVTARVSGSKRAYMGDCGRSFLEITRQGCRACARSFFRARSPSDAGVPRSHEPPRAL